MLSIFNKIFRRPSPKDVVHRIVLLKQLVVYAVTAPPRDALALLEGQWGEQDRLDFAHSADLKRISFWQPVHENDLWRVLTPREKEFANTTAVTMTERQRVDYSWRLEGIAMLMWAAGMLSELPPYDQDVSPDILKQISLSECQRYAKLGRFRGMTDVDAARDVAEMWHWRSRTRELIEEGRPLNPDDSMKSLGLHSYDDIIRRTAALATESGEIPPCIDGDFPAMGKAYRDLTDSEWSYVRSITIERHFALNWLCGYAPKNNWDETPTDT